MLTFILMAFAFILALPIPWPVYGLTGIVDGLVFLPLLTYFGAPYMGRFIRQTTGRFWLLPAAAVAGEFAAVFTGRGYEYAPVENDKAYLKDGTVVELDQEKTTWYRLANRRFCVTFEPSEELLRSVLADENDKDISLAATSSDGYGILKRARGGLFGITKYPDGVEQGFLISLSKAISSLREGGGVRLSEETEKHTLKREGGGSDMSNKTRLIVSFGTILLAAASGILIFGVLS